MKKRFFAGVVIIIGFILVAIGFYTQTAHADAIALAVTNTQIVQGEAQADDTFEHGWAWIFNLTIPENETLLSFTSSDFVDGDKTISVFENTRAYISSPVDSAPHFTLSAAGDSQNLFDISNATDTDSNLPGRQITFNFEVKIPTDAQPGNYSNSYNFKSEAPEVVVVPDTTAPIIAPHEDVYAESTNASGSIVVYTLPTVTDNHDVGLIATCAPISGSLFPVGETVVNCSATDLANNTTNSSFLVTVTPIVVVDTEAPVILPRSNVIQEATGPAGAIVSYLLPTVNDNVDHNLIASCVLPPGSVFPLGTTIVTCTATDTAGNSAQSTVNIIVVDTTAPVITLNGNAEVTAVVGTYVDAGATATDLVDGNISSIVVSLPVDMNTAGTYVITYSVSDAHGNIASPVIRTIHIVPPSDTTGPVISTHENIIYGSEIGEHVTASGAVITYIAPTATDNIDPVVVVNCSPVSGTEFPLGFTTVTCSATDTSGNTSSSSFNVLVRDEEAPVIILNGEAEITLNVGDTYVELGATALDNVAGVVSVTISGTVNSAVPGDYFISYTAGDNSTPSNLVSRNRTIHIVSIVQVTHTITASAGANGSISPSGVVSVNEGGNKSFTISTSDKRHKILEVIVDGSFQPGVLPCDSPVFKLGPCGFDYSYTYLFSGVTADHTIEVTFDDDYVLANLTSKSREYAEAILNPSPVTPQSVIDALQTALDNASGVLANPLATRLEIYLAHNNLFDASLAFFDYQ